MAQPHEQQPDLAILFADLFEKPSIERMLGELTDDQFEDFVKYVFERAGYIVENSSKKYGQGLDLRLYDPDAVQTALAGVSVKQLSHDPVNGPHVMLLRGALNGLPGYVVTTSTFNGPAVLEAKKPTQIWPVDRDHWLRYITYVRGSRSKPNASGAKNPIPIGRVPHPIHPEVLFDADEVVRQISPKTKVLAVANHKGGVGKTTTALNIAFGLASKERDQQVLLVDMDPQANLTQALHYPQADSAISKHLGDYFSGAYPLADLVRQTQFDRVWLIPSHGDLSHAETGVAAGPEAEVQFVRNLRVPQVVPPPALDARPFDWIILDTGPSMGFLTRSALAASDYVLMPLEPGAFADMGLNLLTRTVQTMRALMGSSLTILGCLVTQWKDDKLNQDLLAGATKKLDAEGIPLLPMKIPLDKSHIEKAHVETGQGKKKNIFDHRCASAEKYLEAVEEVVKGVNTRRQ